MPVLPSPSARLLTFFGFGCLTGMEATRSGRGLLTTVAKPDLRYEVRYELRFSCRIADSLAPIFVDVKSLVREDGCQDLPLGECVLIEQDARLRHRVQNLGPYIGWRYLGAE